MRLALLLLFAPVAHAGVVEGRVVSAAGNDPVRRASVSARRPGQVFTVETNSAGVFRIDGLEPGAYTLSVQRNGFRDSGAREFDIGPDAHIRDIVVTLTPLSVITGRILDSDGDPISGMTVRAMRPTYANGKRQLVAASTATSDDRGVYRLFDLAPGRYFVQASRNGSAQKAFYPSALDAAAAVAVTAAAGDEARGINVQFGPPSSNRVRIRIANAVDIMRVLRQGMAPGRVPIMMNGTIRGGGEFVPGRMLAGNIYEAVDVPAGRYVFQAWQIDPEHPDATLSARRAFTVVGGDVELDVALLPGISIPGIVAGLPDPEGITVRLDSADEQDHQGRAQSGKNGAFLIKNVPQNRYSVRISAPEGYYLRSIRLGERVLDSQIADLTTASGSILIQFGEDGGEIAGLAPPNATVAIEPAAADWPDRFKSTTADGTGNFRLHDVAPGEYRILAWIGDEPDFSQAVPIKVESEGDHRIILRIP